MTKALHIILLSLLLGISPGPICCLATNTSYIRELYDVSDGLSDNMINTIFCDSRGILWIGTQFGIEWYDGYRFRHVYVPGRTNVNVIPDSIFEDGDDIIVGTLDGLLVIGKDGVVKKFLDIPLARSLLRTKDGYLWIASISKGLRRIDSHDFSVTYYPPRGKAIAADGEGNLYQLNYDCTVCLLTDDNHKEKPILRLSHEFSVINIFDGRLFAFSDNETEVYDLETRKRLKDGLPGIKKLVKDSRGRVWVATTDGIHILNDKLELENVSDESGNDVASTGDRKCICVDGSDGIWVGSSKGLEHLSINRWGVRRIDLPVSGSIRRMALDDDGKLWISTGNGRLFRFDPEKSSFENIAVPWLSGYIKSIFPEGENLLISTFNVDDHVVGINRKTLKMFKYDDVIGQCSSFCRDDYGRLWFGAYLCSGYRGENGFIPTTHLHYATMTKDSSGVLWGGVRTMGPRRLNHDGSEIVYDSENGKFLSRGLLQLSCDKDGRILALTGGDGLFVYDSASDSFVKEKGLPYGQFGKMEYMYLRPYGGGILISSNSGLIHYKPDSGEWSLLRRKGIFSNCFNGYAVCADKEGRLYLGSDDCFLLLDMDKMAAEGSSPGKITFTSIYFVESTLGKRSSFKLKGDIDRMSSICLPHDCNTFRIYVTDMDFNNLKTGRLVYRLEGYSDKWSQVRNGAVEFIDIPKGKYELLVRIVNSDGTLSEQERRLSISVKAPLWASPFAIMGYVVLLFCIISFIVRHSVRRKEEKLSAEAALREAEREKNLYASKVEFLSSVAHEIKTPLSLVKLPAESIAKHLGDTKDKELKTDIEALQRNSDALSNLVDDLLDFQKLEHSTYKIETARRDICSLTTEISERFRNAIDKAGINFSIKLPSCPCLVEIDTRVFDKILTNLFSNAIKYTSTYIKCSLSIKGGNMLFKIENDGAVVPADMREKIFSAFVRYDNGRHYIEGTGIGLYSSRQFADLLGGKLSMDNDVSVNRFILSLPLTRASGCDAANSIVPEPQLSQPLVAPMLHRHLLLVVEDNVELSGFIENGFNAEYDVLRASDGLEALNLMEGGNIPSVVISDVMMPNMDGIELCRRMKADERFATIPFVVLTAKYGNDIQLQALETRADAFLQKPFSMDMLRAVVKSQLGNRRILAEYYATGHLIDPAVVKSTSPDNKLLLKVQEYIIANISNSHIVTSDIADYCAVSLSSLQKKMKQITGMGPAEYLLHFRMKEATRLLSDPAIPISEISIRLGFATHSHFSFCFKREYGITPVQWREGR